MDERTAKRLGKGLLIAGLSVLLFSWIAEKTFSENYESRLDIRKRGLANVSNNNLSVKIDRLAVDVRSFQIELRQVDLTKQLQLRDLPLDKRNSARELLSKFDAEQAQLTDKAEKQAEDMLQGFVSNLRNLIPGKADELGEQWNNMMRQKNPNLLLADALKGPLAGQFEQWQQQVREETIREQEQDDRLSHIYKLVFKALYVIGSLLVLVSEWVKPVSD